ncbi:MAG TPA: hypothetical protein VEK08_23600 [Planctomycetota bacterium]|nr:hypothetical protein [Planctomycetota bacterium]
MRLVSSAVAAVLFATLLSPAAAAERFVNKDGGYSIQFPEGWTAQKEGHGAAAANAAGDTRVEIEAGKLPNGVTVDKYMAINAESFQKSLNDFKKVKTGQIANPINSQVRLMVITFKGANGPVTMTYYYVFSTKDRKLWTIACATTPDKFEARSADFDAIVRSMALE